MESEMYHRNGVINWVSQRELARVELMQRLQTVKPTLETTASTLNLQIRKSLLTPGELFPSYLFASRLIRSADGWLSSFVTVVIYSLLYHNLLSCVVNIHFLLRQLTFSSCSSTHISCYLYFLPSQLRWRFRCWLDLFFKITGHRLLLPSTGLIVFCRRV